MYAIRGLSRIAMIGPDRNVLIDEICDGTDLPKHFVAKILQQLVRDGLLTSTKGRGGGFALARTPEKITLFEIVAAVDGDQQFDQCAVGLAKCDDDQPCPMHDKWSKVRDRIEKLLRTTTLKQMSETLAQKLRAQQRRKA